MTAMLERVYAAHVQPGDTVGRTRTHLHLVTRVELLTVAVRLTYENGGTIRPAKTAQLWRRVREQD